MWSRPEKSSAQHWPSLAVRLGSLTSQDTYPISLQLYLSRRSSITLILLFMHFHEFLIIMEELVVMNGSPNSPLV